MRDLAGNVLQVVRPRTADNDCVIQREGTGKKCSGRAPVASETLRTQPAILHYRVRIPRRTLGIEDICHSIQLNEFLPRQRLDANHPQASLRERFGETGLMPAR